MLLGVAGGREKVAGSGLSCLVLSVCLSCGEMSMARYYAFYGTYTSTL